uniref:Uncharacterized protein n=1 Tax=Oryza meridionalis TaxID=40149 RepID=A0A0E0EQU9_9ORYZ
MASCPRGHFQPRPKEVWFFQRQEDPKARALCLEYQSGKSAVYQDVQEKSCYQLQPENLISLLFRITGLTVLTVAQNFAALQEAL